jgi:hypothetical protein
MPPPLFCVFRAALLPHPHTPLGDTEPVSNGGLASGCLYGPQ